MAQTFLHQDVRNHRETSRITMHLRARACVVIPDTLCPRLNVLNNNGDFKIECNFENVLRFRKGHLNRHRTRTHRWSTTKKFRIWLALGNAIFGHSLPVAQSRLGGGGFGGLNSSPGWRRLATPILLFAGVGGRGGTQRKKVKS